MAYRVDVSGQVRSVTRTPQGGVLVEAAVRKVGVLCYPRADGTVQRELVLPDEMGSGLRNAPVTHRHPPGAVTSKNYKQYSVGHVDGDGRLEDGHQVATLAIQADDALTAISAGTREVSAGYTCDLDETPGVWEGQAYDAVQRNVRFNHVALVPRGRAGSSVCLRLDSNGDTVVSDSIAEETGMDPKDIAKLQADLIAANARADKAEAQRDAATARADAATARADAAELASVVATANKILGKDFRADGLTAAQIKIKIAAKANPTLRLDGQSEAYVTALYDRAAADAEAKIAPAVELRAGLRAVPGQRADAARPSAKPFRSAAQARAEMIERHENAWRGDQSKGQ